MVKGSRHRGAGKSKSKGKTPVYRSDVVSEPSSQTVTTDIVKQTATTDVVQQTVDPTDPMQHILNPAGVKLAAFMKSVQQNTTPAIANRVVNRQQSFEVIQTMLHVSLTYICYLRDLLPTAAFNVRNLAHIPENVHWPYSDMVNGVLPQMAVRKDAGFQKSLQMFVFAQERHAGAKKLMSWLDGIFDALSRNVLSSLQISIILDKDKPSEIIESYTFTMKYFTDPETSIRQLIGLTVSPSVGGPIALVDVRSGLETIWKQLSHAAERLPGLPPRRYLTVHIFYTDDCDPSYHPPLFKPSNDLEILVPHNDLWQMSEVDIGHLNTGYHQVGLKIRHLKAVDSSEKDDEEDTYIPQALHYTRSIARIMKADTIGNLDEAETSGGHVRGIMMQRRLRSMKRIPSQLPGLKQTQREEDMAQTPQRKRNSADIPPRASKKTKVDVRSPVVLSQD
ncbi:DNA binding protein [Xylographa trunciseda]|nr:DNA binding protein [Xylographa trunciseda]